MLQHDRLADTWRDNGSLGYGFIHPPKVDRVCHVSGPTCGRYYFGVTRLPPEPLLPMFIGVYHAGIFEASDGNRPGREPFINPLSPFAGRWPDIAKLFDAIHEAGFYVVTTHMGGTYRLVRGEMPPGREIHQRGKRIRL